MTLTNSMLNQSNHYDLVMIGAGAANLSLVLALKESNYEGSVLISERLVSAPWHAWAIVLWQTLGNTLIGYGLWNLLLQRYAAALVAPWALLVPVFGMAASSTFLDESMPWWKWIAAALIIAGLVINLRSTQSSPHSLKVR